MSGSPSERKILLVEDSEDDVFFFRRSLKRSGISCNFTHVSNGGAATEYLQEHQRDFHMIFLDLKIPVLNGFEVLKWIEAQHFKDKLEIIILSGSDDPRDVSSAREMGISDYLVKPVSVEDLTRKLKSWLAK